MIKLKLQIAFIFSIIYCYCISQTNQWTWMNGSDKFYQKAEYGTKGVPSKKSQPGARNGSIGWMDNCNNFWLYGGTFNFGHHGSHRYGNYEKVCFELYGDSIASVKVFSDLWKYSIESNEWTWMSGDSSFNQPAIYGEKGVAASNNNPGYRVGACSWKDKQGNFWLFGGHQNNFINRRVDTASWLNDIWKYDIATNQWTWIAGSDSIHFNGFLGIKGIASKKNSPLSFKGNTWTDLEGNFWLYSYYYSEKAAYVYSEQPFLLWKFDITTYEWTWVNGDTTADYAIPRFGTKGIADYTVNPGFTCSPFGNLSFVDKNTGDLWLYSDGTYSVWGNLWKYSIKKNQWTWVNGDTSIIRNWSDFFIPSRYGLKGIASNSNLMKGRSEGISWVDDKNNFWIFGGINHDLNEDGLLRWSLNELWKYNLDSNQWSWEGGDTTFKSYANYGSKGVALYSNLPGGRASAVGAADSCGNLWLFGGSGFATSTAPQSLCELYNTGNLNDLWYFSPSGKPCLNRSCKAVCDSTLVVSNAFSPNGDGINDLFKIQMKENNCIKTLHLKIFNRWGNLVFETNNITEGWNGMYLGNALKTDVFVYSITGMFENNMPLSKFGNVTLLK